MFTKVWYVFKTLFVFAITMLALSGIVSAQPYFKVLVGGSNPNDTTYSSHHFRNDKTVRLPFYANSDTTKYLTINALGFLEYRTASPGTSYVAGYGITISDGNVISADTFELATSYGLSTKIDQGDLVDYVTKGDSVTLYATRYDLATYQPAGNKIYYVPNYVQSDDTAYDQALNRAIRASWLNNFDGDVVIEQGIHELKDSVLITAQAAYDSSVIYHPYCIIPVPQSLPNSTRTGRLVIRGVNSARYAINKDSSINYNGLSVLKTLRRGHSALSNGRAYMIGHSGDNQTQPNATALTVKDLVFITPNGAGIGAVSGQNGSSTHVIDCIATRDTALPYMNDVSGMEGNDAFCFRQFNFKDVNNYVENVTAIGYHNAVAGACGFTAGVIRAIGCYNGYMAHRSCATQYVDNLYAINCRNAVGTIETGSHLADTCHFKIDNLTVVAGTDSTKWYYTRYGLYDKYDNGVGNISSYNFYYNGLRRNDLFFEYQGTNVATYPLTFEAEPQITAGNTSQYLRGDKSWQTLDKTAVGLGNVDNTSDANKPVSTATQTALDGKVSYADTAAMLLAYIRAHGWTMSAAGRLVQVSGGSIDGTNNVLDFSRENTVSSGNTSAVRIGLSSTYTQTSGNNRGVHVFGTLTSSSGTNFDAGFTYGRTINRTGTSTGIDRGLYIAPAITSVIDFRGLWLDYNNANSWGVYQSGNLTKNYAVGEFLFGSLTDAGAYQIQVTGASYLNGAVTIVGLPEYADNAAALAGGLTAGRLYRTGDDLKVVH